MATKRAYRGADQWRAILRKHQNSCLTVRNFCHENGLGYASFVAWRRRLDTGERSVMPASSSFIELTPGLTDAPAVAEQWPLSVSGTPANEADPLTIELSLGGGIGLRITRAS